MSGQRKIVVTNEEEFEERKKKVCKQLENLKKQTSKGKINASISNKLKVELEAELEKIQKELIEKLRSESKEIQSELDTMQAQMSELKKTQDELTRKKEELEARFRIKQIERKEYNDKRRAIEQQMEKTSRETYLDKIRTEKLEARLKLISQKVQDKMDQTEGNSA